MSEEAQPPIDFTDPEVHCCWLEAFWCAFKVHGDARVADESAKAAVILLYEQSSKLRHTAEGERDLKTIVKETVKRMNLYKADDSIRMAKGDLTRIIARLAELEIKERGRS